MASPVSLRLLCATSLILTCFFNLGIQGSPPRGRIVGGVRAKIRDMNHIVSLHYIKGPGTQFFCGGSLIKPNVVLTAGHCVVDFEDKSIILVRAGSANPSNRTYESELDAIIIPPEYNSTNNYMDVAILRLTKSFPLSADVGLASFYLDNVEDNVTVAVSGWGMIQENNTNLPTVLQTVNVTTISNALCEEKYKNSQDYIISEYNVCAVGFNKDSCSGDSGGPVTINNMLCGVVSDGIGCAREAFPGIYTRIKGEVKDFISRIMEETVDNEPAQPAVSNIGFNKPGTPSIGVESLDSEESEEYPKQKSKGKSSKMDKNRLPKRKTEELSEDDEDKKRHTNEKEDKKRNKTKESSKAEKKRRKKMEKDSSEEDEGYKSKQTEDLSEENEEYETRLAKHNSHTSEKEDKKRNKTKGSSKADKKSRKKKKKDSSEEDK